MCACPGAQIDVTSRSHTRTKKAVAATWPLPSTPTVATLVLNVAFTNAEVGSVKDPVVEGCSSQVVTSRPNTAVLVDMQLCRERVAGRIIVGTICLHMLCTELVLRRQSHQLLSVRHLEEGSSLSSSSNCGSTSALAHGLAAYTSQRFDRTPSSTCAYNRLGETTTLDSDCWHTSMQTATASTITRCRTCIR